MPIPEGVGTSGDEETIDQTTTQTQVGRVSPDGQWLAYASDERGRSDVYVSRVSQPEEQPWQVLAGGRATSDLGAGRGAPVLPRS